MKHKITYRLIGYFSFVLLLFALIVGVLFSALFTHHTAEIHEKDLTARAVSIADTLSQFSQENRRGPGMGGGYGAYLRFIDDIAMSEVWLVDERAQTIQMGHMGASLSYDQLPAGAEKLIRRVFEGKTETNREFSSLLGVPSITVGAPVCDTEGHVAAALLLHSPVSGIKQAQQDGLLILALCILAALLLAASLSVVLAHHFINPLTKMGRATERMAEGDYSVPTGVIQNDEIGSLAHNIDELSFKLSRVEKEREKLDKMRQDFVSNISHELRTPVTVLKGSLEVLVEGLITDPKEIQEYFHQMLADTNHLQRLVNDLLELSRLQNTSFQIEKTDLNLTDVLTEAIHSMQKVACQKQVRLVFKNEPGAVRFYGDYGRLRQMFLIILDNAVKFSPPKDQVLIHVCHTQNEYMISVTDHGRGVLQEDIPYIFDRFYKERSEENKSGSGLGLSIAKQIADRHDILIRCESDPGKSTSFSFTWNGRTNEHPPEQQSLPLPLPW